MNSKLFASIILMVIVVIIIGFPVVSKALNEPGAGGGGIGGGIGGTSGGGSGAISLPNPLGKTTTIGQVVRNIVKFLIRLVFYIAPIMVVYAGFTYATAGGNEERIKLAQRVLVWALIGLALALIAQAVPNLLYEFFTGQPPSQPPPSHPTYPTIFI